MAERIIATILDPEGRSVVLAEARWAHIIAGHPELRPFLESVLEAVQSPSRRLPGHHPGEEWCYKAGGGPSQWLKVVVRYEASGGGRIVTAFARRSLP